MRRVRRGARPATEAVAAALPNATVRPLAGQGRVANMTAPELLASEILTQGWLC